MNEKVLLFLLIITATLSFKISSSQEWSEKQQINRPPNNIFGHRYGYDISSTNEYLVVGSFEHDKDENGENSLENAGACYIYSTNASGNWVLDQKLVASDREEDSYFGISVLITDDNEYVFIGSSRKNGIGINNATEGAVYVFHKTNDIWEQIQKIDVSDTDPEVREFGYSLTYHDGTLVIGAPSYQSKGAAYIFEKVNNLWEKQQRLNISSLPFNSTYASSIAINGNNLSIGAPGLQVGDDGFDVGAVFIYEKTEGTWEYKQELSCPNPHQFDRFGRRVQINGNNIIVNTWGEDFDEQEQNEISNAGCIYLYKIVNNNWEFVKKITEPVREANNYFGDVCFLYDDILYIGSQFKSYNGKTKVGRVYEYEVLNDDLILNQEIFNESKASYSFYGSSLCKNETVLFAGSNSASEQVYVMRKISKRIYVNPLANGNNDGTSWNNAYTSLHDALNVANEVDSIWITKGNHFPTEEADGSTNNHKYFTFKIEEGVRLFGGFIGTETNLDQRNNYGPGEENETVLNGDLNSDDNEGNTIDNVLIVATNSMDEEFTDSSRLDGISIEGSAIFNIILVSSDATGNNNGSNWQNAYNNIQDGIDAANSGDEIWVSKGTYFPTNQVGGVGSRFKTFQMKNDVGIYGGFAGTEISKSQRTNHSLGEINETILSGDLSENDVISGSGATLVISNMSENCYHIFRNEPELNLSNSAILDGFTLKGGNSSGNDNSGEDDGGAIHNRTGNTPTINNCIFIGNQAYDKGGAICNDTDSDVTISNCTFMKNVAAPKDVAADGGGGAIYNYNANPNIINCLFNGNQAGNDSGDQGGAIWNNNGSEPYLINLTIVENSAYSGGGVYNENNSNANIISCIIWGNLIQGGAGDQVRNWNDCDPIISYCNIQNGISEIANGDGSSVINGGSNMDVDPEFAGDLNIAHPFSIVGSSPCVDFGKYNANSELYDIRGQMFERKLSGADGSNGQIDIGAYEFKYGVDPSSLNQIIWTGEEDSDWNKNENWSTGSKPIATSDVIIPVTTNDPIIATGSGEVINNLNIIEGAKLTLQHRASIVTNGTIDIAGDFTIEKSIDESIWHWFSCPVEDQTALSFEGDYLQYWSESTKSWSEITDLNTDIEVGTGYLIWITSKTNYSFTGKPTNGNISFPLSYSDTGHDYDGMNLVGNPYPSFYDWDSQGQGTKYTWNGSDYDERNEGEGSGSKYVAPLEAFFYYTSQSSDQIDFYNSKRARMDDKGSISKMNKNFNGIVLVAKSYNYADELWIDIDDSANESFDEDKDAWKLLPDSEGICQIWSVSSSGKLAIDNRPHQSIIELGFKSSFLGEHTFSASKLEYNASITMEDTKTNRFHNLKDGEYTFNWEPYDNENRFRLHFESLGVYEETDNNTIKVYSSNNHIYMQSELNELSIVTISDLSGKTIYSHQENSSLIRIPTRFINGVYLVTVVQNNISTTKKVLVN